MFQNDQEVVNTVAMYQNSIKKINAYISNFQKIIDTPDEDFLKEKDPTFSNEVALQKIKEIKDECQKGINLMNQKREELKNGHGEASKVLYEVADTMNGFGF